MVDSAVIPDAASRLASLPTWLLSRASARSHQLLTTALSAHGVRGYHYRILAALADLGPASQAQLGRIANLDRSDATTAIDELVQRGAVTRAPDPTNGRQNRITMTATGRRLLRSLQAIVDDVQDQVVAQLSARERTQLINLLTRLLT